MWQAFYRRSVVVSGGHIPSHNYGRESPQTDTTRAAPPARKELDQARYTTFTSDDVHLRCKNRWRPSLLGGGGLSSTGCNVTLAPDTSLPHTLDGFRGYVEWAIGGCHVIANGQLRCKLGVC
ncbi:hypothetical protein LSH36_68g07011 [Paralvinella palmiformis]|uniref:Uncharacterized protein n=1 Tax=Paralvinella palmiformis TaxID=53620 RepID=A0AAD9K3C2_9ANNE|nr:hypothetical protein LSH36_68g07011 [Paralvinella palmiformis]